MNQKTRHRRSLRSPQSGQGMVEYAILLALIALAVIGSVALASQSVQDATAKTTNNIAERGSDFVPGEAPTLGANNGLQPTVPPRPTNTATPIPPTATSTPTNTATSGPTNTPTLPPPTNTPTPKPPTATPNATQTAAAFATISYESSGGAIRYRVDPTGWPSRSGFCGQGDAQISGNEGLYSINLYGDGGDVVCFRIDVYIGSMTNQTETHNFDITNQQGNGSPNNVQMSLQKQTVYSFVSTSVSNVLFTKQSNGSSDVIPFYLMLKLPPDVCTNNQSLQTLQFKARDDSNSHGIKINTVCRPRPTPTVTNTPAVTATPTMTATPLAPTPTATPGDINT